MTACSNGGLLTSGEWSHFIPGVEQDFHLANLPGGKEAKFIDGGDFGIAAFPNNIAQGRIFWSDISG